MASWELRVEGKLLEDVSHPPVTIATLTLKNQRITATLCFSSSLAVYANDLFSVISVLRSVLLLP